MITEIFPAQQAFIQRDPALREKEITEIKNINLYAWQLLLPKQGCLFL